MKDIELITYDKDKSKGSWVFCKEGVLSRKGNVNEFDDSNNTPLMASILLANDAPVSKLILFIKNLIEAGADLNLANKYGHTALKLAIDLKNYELVEYLVDHGANINHVSMYEDIELDTPLTIALYGNSCDLKMLKILIKKGTYDNLCKNAAIPLKMALIKENLEEAKLLIAYGADIHMNCNHSNQTILEYYMLDAFFTRNINKVAILLEDRLFPEVQFAYLSDPKFNNYKESLAPKFIASLNNLVPNECLTVLFQGLHHSKDFFKIVALTNAIKNNEYFKTYVNTPDKDLVTYLSEIRETVARTIDESIKPPGIRLIIENYYDNDYSIEALRTILIDNDIERFSKLRPVKEQKGETKGEDKSSSAASAIIASRASSVALSASASSSSISSGPRAMSATIHDTLLVAGAAVAPSASSVALSASASSSSISSGPRAMSATIHDTLLVAGAAAATSASFTTFAERSRTANAVKGDSSQGIIVAKGETKSHVEKIGSSASAATSDASSVAISKGDGSVQNRIITKITTTTTVLDTPMHMIGKKSSGFIEGERRRINCRNFCIIL
jgi:ankyrin repeat protein